jgi:hypothetical protein
MYIDLLVQKETKRGWPSASFLLKRMWHVSPAPQCQLSTSVHKVHVNCVSHMTLRHLLTHIGCVYSRSLLLSQYNNLLLPFTAVHHIRHGSRNASVLGGLWPPLLEAIPPCLASCHNAALTDQFAYHQPAGASQCPWSPRCNVPGHLATAFMSTAPTLTHSAYTYP